MNFAGKNGFREMHKMYSPVRRDHWRTTPPTQQVGGGGLGVKIGGTDGREGLMGGREGGM